MITTPGVLLCELGVRVESGLAGQEALGLSQNLTERFVVLQTLGRDDGCWPAIYCLPHEGTFSLSFDD